MAAAPGPLYRFPWEDWGNGKYLLMAPFVASVVFGYDDKDNWNYHVLCIAALRYLNAQAWQMASRAFCTSEKRRIQTKMLEFKQVDREDHWDDYIILQSLIMTFVHWYLPGYGGFPTCLLWPRDSPQPVHFSPIHDAPCPPSLYGPYSSLVADYQRSGVPVTGCRARIPFYGENGSRGYQLSEQFRRV